MGDEVTLEPVVGVQTKRLIGKKQNESTEKEGCLQENRPESSVKARRFEKENKKRGFFNT